MIEPQLVALLGTFVDNRVYPDVAPQDVALPFCIFEQVGGKPLNFLSGDVPDKKNALIQINVWATTRAQAMSIIRSMEDALVGAPLYATVASGAQARHDPDTDYRGVMQDFSLWG